MTAAIEVRRFDTPDDVIDMKEAGGVSIIKMADGTTGMRAVFEPGWTWEKDEKPLLGSPDACPMRHTGYCIAGKLVIRMVEANEETRITPGDFFEIPPGHDAYVDGAERVELILFAAPEQAH
ncbi:MAG: cupin domain-containing protein [Sphingomonas sp.]|nr:cupin domain-containing protein [Sphingomonas sp.]